MAYMKPYKFNYCLCFIWYVLCVASFGVLLLLGRWMPWLKLKMTHLRSTNSKATKMLIKVRSINLHLNLHS
jgi:hypothetical protein